LFTLLPFPFSLAFSPRLGEIQLVERNVPMRVENLEPAVLFFLERRLIGEQPPDDLFVARRGVHCRHVLIVC